MDEITDPTFLISSALQERTKRQAQILQHFQQQWKREYLTSLRDTHKGTNTFKQTIKVGDIVLVHDDVPRSQWQLAVIEVLIEGLDGYTRAAKIRTANQPVAKLFPLEVLHVRPVLPMGMTMLTTKIMMTKMNLLLSVNGSQGMPLSGLVTVSRTGVTYYPWPWRKSLILT